MPRLWSSPRRSGAADLKGKAVPILAAAQGLGPDFGTASFQGRWFPGMFYGNVGQTIWDRAGIRPADVDVLQMYENFTGPVAMALCELGYCEPEELGAFTANGALEGPDARLPFNTSGGNIGEAYIHGFEMVIEAVRQVRGDSTCQAANVELSLAVGWTGLRTGQRCAVRRPRLVRPRKSPIPARSPRRRNHDEPLPRRRLPAAGADRRTTRPCSPLAAIQIQFCDDCGHAQHPPEDLCYGCQGTSLGFRAMPGDGTVESASSGPSPDASGSRRARVRTWSSSSRSTARRVATSIGNVVGCPPDAVAIGHRVRAVFEDARDPATGTALRIPQWEPLEADLPRGATLRDRVAAVDDDRVACLELRGARSEIDGEPAEV